MDKLFPRDSAWLVEAKRGGKWCGVRFFLYEVDAERAAEKLQGIFGEETRACEIKVSYTGRVYEPIIALGVENGGEEGQAAGYCSNGYDA